MADLSYIPTFTISEALDIAEDITTNYYKFSFAQWKRYLYEVKTNDTALDGAPLHSIFARLTKSYIVSNSKSDIKECFFIWLQKQAIFSALKRDSHLKLLPLLVYIFTHELVHIIRFRNFHRLFNTSAAAQKEEEQIVHNIAFAILNPLSSMASLDYVLKVYVNHR